MLLRTPPVSGSIWMVLETTGVGVRVGVVVAVTVGVGVVVAVTLGVIVMVGVRVIVGVSVAVGVTVKLGMTVGVTTIVGAMVEGRVAVGTMGGVIVTVAVRETVGVTVVVREGVSSSASARGTGSPGATGGRLACALAGSLTLGATKATTSSRLTNRRKRARLLRMIDRQNCVRRANTWAIASLLMLSVNMR